MSDKLKIILPIYFNENQAQTEIQKVIDRLEKANGVNLVRNKTEEIKKEVKEFSREISKDMDKALSYTETHVGETLTQKTVLLKESLNSTKLILQDFKTGVETTIDTTDNALLDRTQKRMTNWKQKMFLEIKKVKGALAHISPDTEEMFKILKENILQVDTPEKFLAVQDRINYSYKELVLHAKEYNKTQNKINAKTKKELNDLEKVVQWQKIMNHQLNDFANKNEKYMDKDKFLDLRKQLNTVHLAEDIKKAKDNFTDLNKGFINMTNASKRKAQIAKKDYELSEMIKTAFVKFPIWITASSIIMGFIHELGNAIKYIVDLDTAMVDLRKVTNETMNTYSEFQGEAREMGKALAKTSIDVVQATTNFARMGYSFEEAKKLAQTAIIASNVGDIDDINKSTEILISTMKGFNIEAEKSLGIIDILNEVSNKHSITVEGLGDALQRSSASMQLAGNTIEETVALITSANAIVQNPERIGNALKTISMRIRQIEDENGEVFPKLEGQLRSVGVEIRKTDNSFKTTFNVLKELSNVWDDLDDFSKAQIVESLAGKYQGNVLTSILSNFSEAEETLNDALDSVGSATKENEIYLQSLSAQINNMKVEMEGIYSNFVNNDSLEGFITALTFILKIISQITYAFGGLPVVVGLATTAFITFHAQLNKTFVESQIGIKIVKLSEDLARFTATANGAKLATKLWTGSLIFLASTIATMAITKLISLLSKTQNAYASTMDMQIESMKNTQKEIDTVDSLIKKLEQDNLAKTEQIKIQKELAQILPEATTGYTAQNEAIAESIGLVKQLNDVRKEELEAKAYEMIGEVGGEQGYKTLYNNTKEVIKQREKLLEGLKAIDEAEKKNGKKTSFDLQRKAWLDELKKLTPIVTTNIEILKKAGIQFAFLNDNVEGHNVVILDTNELYGENTDAVEANTKAKAKNADETEEQLLTGEALSKQIKDTESSLTLLHKAMDEMNEEGKLSNETIKDLIIAYPELITEIGKENTALIDAIKIRELETMAFIESEKKKTNGRIEETTKRLSLLRSELLQEQKVYEEQYKMQKARITNSIASGAITDIEGEKRLSKFVVHDRKRLENEITNEIAKIQGLENHLQGLNKLNDIFAGVGRDKNKDKDKDKKDYEAKLDESFNELQNIAKLQEEINALQNEKNLATQKEKLKLISKEIELQNKLIDLYTDATPIFNKMRNNLVDKFKASELGSIITDYDTLQIDNNAYNLLSDENIEKVDEFVSSIKEVDSNISNATDSIYNAKNSIKDLNNEIKTLYTEWQENTKEVAEKVVDIYKDFYQQELDELEQSHNKKMDLLDEELSKYEEIINAKLDSLDDEANEEDYQKELAKMQKERQELVNKINVLSMDDSIEAKAQLAELNKELADKEMEIEEKKTGHTREQRKDNLNDQLEAYKKDVEAKKETETDKYEAEKSRLENLVNDERAFTKIREQIMEGHTDNVQLAFAMMVAEIEKNSEVLGSSITNNLIDKLKEAQALMNKVDYNLLPNPEVGLGEGNNTTEDDWDSKVHKLRNDVSYRNNEIARATKVIENMLSVDPKADISKQQSYLDFLKSFHDGGIVGGKGTSGIELLNKMFNLKHNEQIIKAQKGELLIPSKNVPNRVPRLNSVASASGGSSPISYNLNLRIDNLNGTKSDANMVFDTIVNGLKKMGR